MDFCQSLRLIFVLNLLCFYARAFTPLNSSVIMATQQDAQNCSQKVDNALRFNNQRLLLLPTIYFITNSNGISHYCSGNHNHCDPIDQATIALYKNAWANCFKHVLDKKTEITVVPHIDDGSGQGQWRNLVKFNPLKKYGGLSYDDILITPLVDALELASGTKKKEVYFSLEGEMGAEIFSFPKSNLILFERIKKAHPQWKIGIGLNFNAIDGNTGNSDPQSLQKLVDKIDFIGISAYGPLHFPIKPQDFLENVTNLSKDLLTLKVLVSQNKEFQFSEIGLGGGSKSSSGHLPAESPEAAAKDPWAGMTYPYDITQDPWQIKPLRDLRFDYHKALLDFLKTSESSTHVTGAFLWNANSWDPQGLDKTQYFDKEISDLINEYNGQGLLRR